MIHFSNVSCIRETNIEFAEIDLNKQIVRCAISENGKILASTKIVFPGKSEEKGFYLCDFWTRQCEALGSLGLSGGIGRIDAYGNAFVVYGYSADRVVVSEDGNPILKTRSLANFASNGVEYVYALAGHVDVVTSNGGGYLFEYDVKVNRGLSRIYTKIFKPDDGWSVINYFEDEENNEKVLKVKLVRPKEKEITNFVLNTNSFQPHAVNGAGRDFIVVKGVDKEEKGVQMVILKPDGRPIVIMSKYHLDVSWVDEKGVVFGSSSLLKRKSAILFVRPNGIVEWKRLDRLFDVLCARRVGNRVIGLVRSFRDENIYLFRMELWSPLLFNQLTKY